jgi:hypothetical protein
MSKDDKPHSDKSHDDQVFDILVPEWVGAAHREEIKRRTQVILTEILKEKAPNLVASDGDKPPTKK